VKNSANRLGVFILIIAYSLAVGAVTSAFLNKDYTVQNSQQKEYSSKFTNNLLSHTSPGESLVKVENSTNFASHKTPLYRQGLHAGGSGYLWNIIALENGGKAIRFWIQHRRSATIFPFHFFW
jgi:hypothetical protein